MRRFAFLLASCLLASLPLWAQTYAPKKYLVSEEMFGMVTEELSGSLAKENVIGIAKYHRVQASPGFTEAREWVAGYRRRVIGQELNG